MTTASHAHSLRLHTTSPDKTTRIRTQLLTWYSLNARTLPWRTTAPNPSPYSILVSEIMCQQTQIKTVIPYYERWMSTLPTFKDLANANVDDVLRLWSGLGYYSRGRKLLEAAKYVEQNGIPNTVDGWLKVPGVGEYTAGAVSSIAFRVPTGAVDGNVCRVFSRVFLISTDLTKKEGKGLIWKLANELVDLEKPGEFNQAVMEIGATICTPQNPNCESCPLAGECAAFAEGKIIESGKPLHYDIEDSNEICRLCPSFEITTTERGKWISTHYPRKSVKKAPKEQSYVTAVISRKSPNGPEYFLVQRPDTGLLAGLWDFPNIPFEDPELKDSEIQSTLIAHLVSLGFDKPEKLTNKGTSLHIFTHIRRISHVYTVQIRQGEGFLEEGQCKWVSEEEINDMAVSELGRKVLRLALGVEKKTKAVDKAGIAGQVKTKKVVKLEKGQKTLSFSVS